MSIIFFLSCYVYRQVQLLFNFLQLKIHIIQYTFTTYTSYLSSDVREANFQNVVYIKNILSMIKKINSLMLNDILFILTKHTDFPINKNNIQ